MHSRDFAGIDLRVSQAREKLILLQGRMREQGSVEAKQNVDIAVADLRELLMAEGSLSRSVAAATGKAFLIM
ncbi:hypothetical protein Dimus_023983 [Dionaea muscipula]